MLRWHCESYSQVYIALPKLHNNGIYLYTLSAKILRVLHRHKHLFSTDR